MTIFGIIFIWGVICLILGVVLFEILSNIFRSKHKFTLVQKRWIKNLQKSKVKNSKYLLQDVVVERGSNITNYNASCIGIGVITMLDMNLISIDHLIDSEGILIKHKFDKKFPKYAQTRHWKMLGLNDKMGSFKHPVTKEPSAILGYESLTEMSNGHVDWYIIAKMMKDRGEYIFKQE